MVKGKAFVMVEQTAFPPPSVFFLFSVYKKKERAENEIRLDIVTQDSGASAAPDEKGVYQSHLSL